MESEKFKLSLVDVIHSLQDPKNVQRLYQIAAKHKRMDEFLFINDLTTLIHVFEKENKFDMDCVPMLFEYYLSSDAKHKIDLVSNRANELKKAVGSTGRILKVIVSMRNEVLGALFTRYRSEIETALVDQTKEPAKSNATLYINI